MPQLLRNERYRQIRRLIDEKGFATATELSAKFGVSAATIRRDLQEMEERGWILRDHGGALSVDPVVAESSISQRARKQAIEKRCTGQAAARLVSPGETIFIGSGTTTLEMARHLEGIELLTIITNALTFANELTT